MPYSELHIGTPHMDSNHLLQDGLTGEKIHSSLRDSGKLGTFLSQLLYHLSYNTYRY